MTSEDNNNSPKETQDSSRDRAGSRECERQGSDSDSATQLSHTHSEYAALIEECDAEAQRIRHSAGGDETYTDREVRVVLNGENATTPLDRSIAERLARGSYERLRPGTERNRSDNGSATSAADSGSGSGSGSERTESSSAR